jgi:hypothetical protein
MLKKYLFFEDDEVALEPPETLALLPNVLLKKNI